MDKPPQSLSMFSHVFADSILAIEDYSEAHEMNEQKMAGYEWESQWLKEELKEKEEKLEVLGKKLHISNGTIEGLKSQRNEIQKKYELKESESNELLKTYQDAKARKELQKKYKILQKKQKDADATNTAQKIQHLEKANKLQEQILESQEQLLERDKQLLERDKQLLFLKDEMIDVNRDLNKKILEVEHLKIDRDALAKETRLMYIRSALDMFGKTKVRVKDNAKRGEAWEDYFKTYEEAKKALAEENFDSDYVKNTVISIYGKLNFKIRGCHKLESMIQVQKNDFDYNELAFLKTVWKLSPLKKGYLHEV